MKKMVTVFLGILFLLVAGVFGLRCWNDGQYGKVDVDNLPAYYQNPRDISLYPRDIEGVGVEHIEGEYLNGFYLKPERIQHKGIIVTFGGSEGSPAYEQAVMLAQKGYQVLSLFFFGMPNQQPTLSEVPVEYYEEIEAYIRQEIGLDGSITLIGTSKGAEYSLLLASLYDSIDHVVLYAPSSHIFGGLDFEHPSSSWTKNGKALPYLDMMDSFSPSLLLDFITKSPVSYKETYAAALQTDQDREDKRIKVEHTKTSLVLFAGRDDKLWPSASMAQEIVKKRPEKTYLHLYSGAGHIFEGSGISGYGGIYLALGGDAQANQKAEEDSSQQLLNYLDSWHQ